MDDSDEDLNFDEDIPDQCDEIRAIASKDWLSSANASLAQLSAVKARVYNLGLVEASQLQTRHKKPPQPPPHSQHGSSAKTPQKGRPSTASRNRGGGSSSSSGNSHAPGAGASGKSDSGTQQQTGADSGSVSGGEGTGHVVDLDTEPPLSSLSYQKTACHSPGSLQGRSPPSWHPSPSPQPAPPASRHVDMKQGSQTSIPELIKRQERINSARSTSSTRSRRPGSGKQSRPSSGRERNAQAAREQEMENVMMKGSRIGQSDRPPMPAQHSVGVNMGWVAPAGPPAGLKLDLGPLQDGVGGTPPAPSQSPETIDDLESISQTHSRPSSLLRKPAAEPIKLQVPFAAEEEDNDEDDELLNTERMLMEIARIEAKRSPRKLNVPEGATPKSPPVSPRSRTSPPPPLSSTAQAAPPPTSRTPASTPRSRQGSAVKFEDSRNSVIQITPRHLGRHASELSLGRRKPLRKRGSRLEISSAKSRASSLLDSGSSLGQQVLNSSELVKDLNITPLSSTEARNHNPQLAESAQNRAGSPVSVVSVQYDDSSDDDDAGKGKKGRRRRAPLQPDESSLVTMVSQLALTDDEDGNFSKASGLSRNYYSGGGRGGQGEGGQQRPVYLTTKTIAFNEVSPLETSVRSVIGTQQVANQAGLRQQYHSLIRPRAERKPPPRMKAGGEGEGGPDSGTTTPTEKGRRILRKISEPPGSQSTQVEHNFRKPPTSGLRRARFSKPVPGATIDRKLRPQETEAEEKDAGEMEASEGADSESHPLPPKEKKRGSRDPPVDTQVSLLDRRGAAGGADVAPGAVEPQATVDYCTCHHHHDSNRLFETRKAASAPPARRTTKSAEPRRKKYQGYIPGADNEQKKRGTSAKDMAPCIITSKKPEPDFETEEMTACRLMEDKLSSLGLQIKASTLERALFPPSGRSLYYDIDAPQPRLNDGLVSHPRFWLVKEYKKLKLAEKQLADAELQLQQQQDEEAEELLGIRREKRSRKKKGSQGKKGGKKSGKKTAAKRRHSVL